MKDIIGYEGLYAITTCGKVWSHRRQRFLKPADNGHGYLQVILCKDGVRKHYRVHRLVAEAYIPNPENKQYINHKDTVRNHNWVNNLEWATAKENKNYVGNKPYEKGTIKKVRCVETDTIYKNIADAGRQTNICERGIHFALTGKQKTAGGYHWEYVQED